MNCFLSLSLYLILNTPCNICSTLIPTQTALCAQCSPASSASVSALQSTCTVLHVVSHLNTPLYARCWNCFFCLHTYMYLTQYTPGNYGNHCQCSTNSWALACTSENTASMASMAMKCQLLILRVPMALPISHSLILCLESGITHPTAI